METAEVISDKGAERDSIGKAAAGREKSPRRLGARITGAVIVLLIVAAGIGWYAYSSGLEETDDAQINGHIHTIAARIDGTVTAVSVENNHSVKAGETLVELDPTDYGVAVDQATAELDEARAQLAGAHPGLTIVETSNVADLASAGAQVASGEANVLAAEHDYKTAQAHLQETEARLEQAEANLQEAQANDVRAQTDWGRYKLLRAKEEVSQLQYDQYASTAKAQQASVAAGQASVAAGRAAVAADEAAVASAAQAVAQKKALLNESLAREAQTSANAPRQVSIRSADIRNREAGLAAARAALEKARLNLAYTRIVSPASGIVTQRGAERGDRVSTGQQLMQIVGTEDLWVDANFKETQLGNMHPGQFVAISVDALGEKFNGTVEAMPAATGDRASLFPAENATGNYVKIVQRLPVRIAITPGQKDMDKLRPGMSVEPTVHLSR
jgi:membrane fusion protein (multidrug efflux system)